MPKALVYFSEFLLTLTLDCFRPQGPQRQLQSCGKIWRSFKWCWFWCVMILKLMTMWAFWWHLERQMTIMMNVSKAFWQTTQWITFRTLKKRNISEFACRENRLSFKAKSEEMQKKYLCRTSSVCHMSLTQNAVKAMNWGKKKFEVHSSCQIRERHFQVMKEDGTQPTNGNQEKEQTMLRRRASY